MFSRFARPLLKKLGNPSALVLRVVSTAGVVGAIGTSSLFAESVIREAVTDHVFPLHRDRAEGPFRDIEEKPVGQEVLKGIGMRCMLGRCEIGLARAYSVGLYLREDEETHFKDAELQWKGVVKTDDPKLSTDKDILESIASNGKEMSLVLVMARNVNGKHIGKGFDRSLIPRIRRMYNGERNNPGKEALREFTMVFNTIPELYVNDRIIFTWKGEDTLHVAVERDNRPSVVHTIHSPALCAALKDTYLGHESVFAKYKATSFKMPLGENISSN